jgi:PPOX class probable F420-dependent enzyme
MGSLDLLGLPEWGRELLEQAPVARLGFLDGDGRPRVLPVTFAVWQGAAWSAVDADKPKRSRELARLRWLRLRPDAALTADRYADDWSKLAWVQLLGRVEVIEDPEEAPGALEALAAKYAPYRERRPAGPLLRLDPHRALRWRAAGDQP